MAQQPDSIEGRAFTKKVIFSEDSKMYTGDDGIYTITPLLSTPKRYLGLLPAGPVSGVQCSFEGSIDQVGIIPTLYNKDKKEQTTPSVATPLTK